LLIYLAKSKIYNFYFLTVLALFKNRISKNTLDTKHKLLFTSYLIFLTLIAGNLLWVKPASSLFGLAIVILGIPVYWLMKKNSSKESVDF
jgi:hypothetical protein